MYVLEIVKFRFWSYTERIHCIFNRNIKYVLCVNYIVVFKVDDSVNYSNIFSCIWCRMCLIPLVKLAISLHDLRIVFDIDIMSSIVYVLCNIRWSIYSIEYSKIIARKIPFFTTSQHEKLSVILILFQLLSSVPQHPSVFGVTINWISDV